MIKLFASITFLLTLLCTVPAYANVKYFQYDGNIPFIEMMLNMMTVMGILDKVPVNYMHDIAYSRYNNYPGVRGVQPQPNIHIYPGVPTIQPNSGLPYNRFNRYGSSPRVGAINPRRDCRTILCGNQVQMLNGLWVADNGEMLGVKNHKFLWNDGNERYLTGVLQVRDGKMIAKPDDVNAQLRFQVTIKNKRLLMRHQNGVVKVLRKVRFDGRGMN